jgi:hypothetical protein
MYVGTAHDRVCIVGYEILLRDSVLTEVDIGARGMGWLLQKRPVCSFNYDSLGIRVRPQFSGEVPSVEAHGDERIAVLDCSDP